LEVSFFFLLNKFNGLGGGGGPTGFAWFILPVSTFLTLSFAFLFFLKGLIRLNTSDGGGGGGGGVCEKAFVPAMVKPKPNKIIKQYFLLMISFSLFDSILIGFNVNMNQKRTMKIG
jgi:hypothetical protein